MAEKYDFRRKDEVILNITNKEKVLRFVERYSDDDDYINFDVIPYYTNEGILRHFLPEGARAEIISTKSTEKTKTEFAIIRMLNGDHSMAEFPIQCRYLTLKLRKPGHRHTSVFV